MDGIERSVWEQIFEDRKVFFDGQEPEYGLSDSEKEDIKYLLNLCNINNFDNFYEVFNR